MPLAAHRIAVCLALGAVVACHTKAKPKFRESLTLGGREVPADVLNRGAEIYSERCESCHGANGGGDGPRSAGMQPPPRDLRAGLFKFGSVPAGGLPTDFDLIRTIVHGLNGTAMVPSELSESDAAAVAQYIKTFSKRWLYDAPGLVLRPQLDMRTEAQRLKVHSRSEWVARGDELYHSTAKCWSCHPAYETKERIFNWNLRQAPELPPNLYDSKPSPSAFGAPILAPDFTKEPLRAGASEEALYRVIIAGVGGTQMQALNDRFDEESLWALAYYVRSLVDLKESGKAGELHKTLAAQADWQPGQ